MASAAVFNAVKARLAANWSRCPIIALNSITEAPEPAWVAVLFPIATEEQKSIGAPGQNIFREAGVIRLVLAIPRGAEIAPWLAWMDELRSLFRAKHFEQVRTYEASPAVLDDRNDDGPLWLLTSAVEYDADFLG
ncbi:phage tail terminator-like protein [Ancylobacter sp.]|uniref:phage tail terminator-like protein n=1 Tax=Ancylobacter sp. TaxID=1872567 RepID=UPI003D0CBB4A